MSYRVLRNEQRKNSKGQDEIFVQIEVNDGTEIYHHAEWLSPDEVASIIADKSKTTIITDAMAARASILRPAIKAEEDHAKEVQLLDKQVEIAKAQAEAATKQLELATAQVELVTKQVELENLKAIPLSK